MEENKSIYAAQILTTDSTFNAIPDHDKFMSHPVDLAVVKDKRNLVTPVEILDGTFRRNT